MPKEWSWFTGHLLTLQKYADRIPPDANVNLAMEDLALEFSDTEIFLMDFWPVYPPLLVIYDPDAAVQVSTKYNLPMTDVHLKFMKPIAGGPSLISMSDNEWKRWRSLFNPGFSTAVMTDNVPYIVQAVQVFSDTLQEKVGNGIFCLDALTSRLTMDVILKTTLGADLDYQHFDNALVTALESIVKWHSFWDPVVMFNPFRPLIQRYYGNVMNTYIRNELDSRYAELRQKRLEKTTSEKSKSAKSVVAKVLEAYVNENEDKNFIQISKIDEHFARYASYQIRLFLFAGNDTTSSSIVYTYHLLSKHPEALRRLRKEHDKVFGKDNSRAAVLLKNTPSMLNQCKYTLAVIKETLRLYSPASTMRGGRRGVSITDRHGNTYPLDHVGCTILHQAVHLNPRVWPRAEEFLPERFLVEPDHELYPNADAFRPFEQGPRSCIGQTLVYNEIGTVLVMTARVFEVKPAYDEWDAKKEREMSRYEKVMRSFVGAPVKTVHGDRAYQTEKAGTHPADGYPCHVSMAKWP